MPQPFQLSADVRIEARGVEANAAPTIFIEGYNGALMSAAPYGLLAIDLSGAVLGEQVPILADHDSTLNGIIGHGRASVQAGRLVVSGKLLPTPTAQTVRVLAQSGMKFQASVGYEPTATPRRIPAGEKVQANGQTLVSDRPWVFIPAGRLREISVLAVAADASTSVSISGKSNMNFQEYLKSLGFDESTLTEAQLAPLKASWQAANGTPTPPVNTPPTGNGNPAPPDPVQAERQRVQAIRAACRGEFPDVEAAAIDQGHSADWASAQCLQLLRANRTHAGVGTAGRTGGGTPSSNRETLEASLLIRAGRESVAISSYGERIAEAARRTGPRSLVDLCEASLLLAGREVPRGRTEMIQAAASTIDLPTILSNTMGRALESAYRETPASWRSFAAVRPAANFKPQAAIRPSFVGGLEPLAPTGEIKHGTLAEAVFPWSVSTFARVLGIDRVQIINDDLNAFSELPTAMGRAAMRSLSDLVWKTIMDNAGSHFSDANGNYWAHNDGALSLSALAHAVTAMRSQRDAHGVDLDIMPKTLVVPPALETTARAILESLELQAPEGDPMGNALKGIVGLEVEPRLGNTDRFPAASDKHWYLFASPQDAPVIVGFLDGQQNPTVQVLGLDSDPNTLTMHFRVWHDYGCALADGKAAFYSLGESE